MSSNSTPIQAIRLKCRECCGNHYSKIRGCTTTDCPLYPYRLGKRPVAEYVDPEQELIDEYFLNDEPYAFRESDRKVTK